MWIFVWMILGGYPVVHTSGPFLSFQDCHDALDQFAKDEPTIVQDPNFYNTCTDLEGPPEIDAHRKHERHK